MLCYKDKWFCTFYRECADKECDRALTAEVRAAAFNWWGDAGAPINVCSEKPECFKEEKKE